MGRHQPKLIKHGRDNTLAGAPTYLHPKPAKLLIDRDEMDPNRAGNRCQTPLYHAAD